MGYCIEMVDCDFIIKKANINKSIKSLKQYVESHKDLMWIEIDNVLNATTIDEIFSAIRYSLTTNQDGNYILDYFKGEKLGDDKDILNSIAQYVEPKSYIEFIGEDGSKIMLQFNGETCEEIWI